MSSKKTNWKTIITQIIKDSWIFPVAATGVALFWENKTALLIAMCVFSALILLQKKSKAELRLFIIVGIVAPFVEMIAIWGGAWAYATPQLWGVPFWLFPLWGVAAIFMYRNAKTIKLV